MARFRKINSGQSLVEFLVAVGIASAILPAILTGFITSREGRVSQDLRLRATSYLREAQEAVRVVREADWNTFAVDGTFHPVISGNTWSLVSGAETISDFTRSVVISDIAPPDPSIKLVTITVSWGGGAISSVTSSQYFTRYIGNANVITENQVVDPPAGGFGNWCQPVGPSVTNVNLVRQGHPTTIDAFESDDGTGNRILAGTGANSSGPAFSNVKIEGNTPPIATLLGDYNGSPSQIKVNGVFADARYAFLATDSKGVEILDLDSTPNPEYAKVGSFNPNGMKKANSVYVVGNTGYVVTQDKFYIFSISSDRTTTAQIGVLTLADGAKIVVDNASQYAYIANPDSSAELKIVDVHTDPTIPIVVGQANVDGAAGRDVFMSSSSDRAYLATAASISQAEFFIINTSTKTGNQAVLSSYDTSGMDPHGVVVVSGERAIIVGEEGNEYQVFSIADDLVSPCPNEDSFLNIDSGVYAVSSVLQSDEHAYSYIATGDSGAELKIIEGGSGGTGGSGTGTFESAPFDAGHDAAFNYFTGTIDPNLSFKVALKQGSCASNTFSDSDFVSFPPGPLPLTSIGSGYINPGRCLVYRAINSGSSPITFKISFNYSP